MFVRTQRFEFLSCPGKAQKERRGATVGGVNGVFLFSSSIIQYRIIFVKALFHFKKKSDLISL